ncbi:MAG: methionine--tRNA ligase [Proteobacteria bacterium]|nr:methionine--tRNA ligase [Pseudomonadota bacterium]
MKRKILVTSALPYANGSIHLGHLVEYIQTDIWVRFQKMRGHECHYVCADDTHGTPIMLRAQKENTTPEQLIERMHTEHLSDFTQFNIEFDSYYSTNSEENRILAETIFARLSAANLIKIRQVEQFYDPEENMFLPDRFIKGECPKCHAKDQYGDSCEICGSAYDPIELIKPRSAISGVTPVRKSSEHYFLGLSECATFLKGYATETHLQPEAAHKMKEWFEQGLKDWDISRDAPYFGFKIPGTEDKYFYVWLDAPIGYMASFMNLAKRLSLDFSEYWDPGSQTELYHFIGKDILYFHALFWPATLHYAGFRTPTQIFAHGFLTVDGEKMSKSRGTFITARSFLDHFNPETLRYYFASKLSDHIEDIDLNFENFISRINSDLVGKFVNIASRASGLIHKFFNGKLAAHLKDSSLLETLSNASSSIIAAYEGREYNRAIREIMQLTDLVNLYIDNNKPWILAKSKDSNNQLHEVLTVAINAFRLLTLYLKPVLPEMAKKIEQFLQIPPLSFKDSHTYLLNHSIAPYEHLIQRIEANKISQLLQANKENLTPQTQHDSKKKAIPSISIEDFQRLDLKVAQVVKAETVDGSNRLLKLTLDIGSSKKTVFSGIRSFYTPESLVGRLVVVVNNLEAKKMRFGTSEGMILAAGDQDIFLISPDTGAKPGMKIQ